MATDPQSLLDVASCYNCFGDNANQLTLMKLGLLRQIVLANNPMADTSPQALLASANCYSCYGSSPYMLQLMELALLAQISSGGGGGGGGSNDLVVNTRADLPASPPNSSQVGTVYFRDGTPARVWDPTNSDWF